MTRTSTQTHPGFAPNPAERATILVVDDVPENLEILGELLRDEYRVRVANSGTRALGAAAAQPPPDLILLDVMMPGMDGYAVIAELRKNPQTRNIPVIFVTAMDTAEDEERGLRLGAIDYITKPIKPAIALARIRTHIELKRARDWLLNQNGALEAEVMRRLRENQLIQDIGICALANLAETRDQETGRHIRRTQAYVEVLAQKLSTHPRFAHYLTPQRIAVIVKAAPLHDIGKVGIPDQILRKEDTLSAKEFEIMKSHSTLGSDAIDNAMRGVLSNDEYAQLQQHCALGFQALDSANPGRAASTLGFLSVAKEIARSHHEKWDGSGYPDGLAGDAIPIPARLMALADIFDALTRKRIYKESLPIPDATEIILRSRGTHLDPDVVDAFAESLGEFIAIAQRYVDAEVSTPPQA
jgi:putative two-component system response regulator